MYHIILKCRVKSITELLTHILQKANKKFFAQLYVLDTSQAVERLNFPENNNCLPNDMHKLYLIMRENPYTLAFKKLIEIENQQTEHVQAQNVPLTRVYMVHHIDCHSENQQYNLPASNPQTRWL